MENTSQALKDLREMVKYIEDIVDTPHYREEWDLHSESDFGENIENRISSTVAEYQVAHGLTWEEASKHLYG